MVCYCRVRLARKAREAGKVTKELQEHLVLMLLVPQVLMVFPSPVVAGGQVSQYCALIGQ